MAAIEKRKLSYRFIVSCGYDMSGRQIEDIFSKQKTKAAV